MGCTIFFKLDAGGVSTLGGGSGPVVLPLFRSVGYASGGQEQHLPTLGAFWATVRVGFPMTTSGMTTPS